MLKTLLGAAAPAKPARGVLPSSRDNPLTIEDGSLNATRRQLAQMLLRDLLRNHGIPLQWIECQMQVVASRSRGSGMTMRLIIKHWDERLMNYCYALQSALVADITRFEPQASEWLHSIAWQLEVAETCPYLTLPEKAFWLGPAKPAPSPTPIARPPRVHVTPIPAVAPMAPISPTPPAAAVSAAAAAALDVDLATPVAPPAETAQEDDALKDLERLFLIRDQALGVPLADDQAAPGYEATQPSAP
ncbi:hypothetical protein [Polaromonas jejuensis]|uniref:Uncharacterized protein n=1 Tax=Polaromonas jejuensis TaxID=457502 RepID=A0ABW0Q3Y2_9BURK|nr:hypothetical protein [Polaromonas jejuensis]